MNVDIFKLIRAVLPILRDIIKASKAESPGGKKVTKEEVEDIIISHLPRLADSILKVIQ
jgi:hypothetical protein